MRILRQVIEQWRRLYKGHRKANQVSTHQPRKRHPFKRAKGEDQARCIDFDLTDYLRLVDWTGRTIRKDKKGRYLQIFCQSLLEWLSLYHGRYLEFAGAFESRFVRQGKWARSDCNYSVTHYSYYGHYLTRSSSWL